jgi:hypothetical protein
VRKVECTACGTSFEAKSPRATYCSSACRKRGSRAGVKASVEQIRPAEDEDAATPLLTATRRELEDAGVAETALGQQAIELARRMSDPRAMGLSVAPISKELRSVMADAMKDAPKASSLDELRARRDRKRHAG